MGDRLWDDIACDGGGACGIYPTAVQERPRFICNLSLACVTTPHQLNNRSTSRRLDCTAKMSSTVNTVSRSDVAYSETPPAALLSSAQLCRHA